jgi:hypothetical protein
LVEREALEGVSRAEAENAMALASTHENAEGLSWKVTLLEDELAVEHRVKNDSRKSPFFKLKVPSYVMPSLVPHG